jgi:membrane-bound lytic murein transglycosylase D
MSNIKRLVPLAFACLTLAACSTGGRPRLDPVPQPAPGPQSRAETCFLAGKAALEKGDMPSARYYFDRTVDLLLDTASPGNRELLNDYVARISAIELNFIKDRSQTNGQESDAFLDEVVATPLFGASEKDVLDLQSRITAQPAVTYSVPMVVNSQVAAFLKAFQTIRHDGIQNALNRSTEYIDRFKEIFRQHGIPEDIVYLPMIESGFRLNATSRAKAKGMWQFMASTARLFGLRVDWIVDERLDPYKSAEAAARYLKSLYDDYNDWYIVLACYNGGPRRVERAINNLQSKDFFELNQTRIMRRETRNYVPAFLASLLIARAPADYGFEITGADPIFGNCKTVTIPSPVSLSKAAALIDIPYEHLKNLNPELLRDFTPPHAPTYELRVPAEVDSTVLQTLERIKTPKSAPNSLYRIRRGDTLSSIARRFRMPLTALKRLNGLRSNMIRPGRTLIVGRGGC